MKKKIKRLQCSKAQNTCNKEPNLNQICPNKPISYLRIQNDKAHVFVRTIHHTWKEKQPL